MASRPALLLVLLTVAACLLSSLHPSAAQTEPFLVTKARSTRAYATNCTNDSVKANATAAQRAQELLAANATLAAAIAAYNDAVPLVNRLKVVLANKIAVQTDVNAKLQNLPGEIEDHTARLERLVAENVDDASMKQAVSDVQRRVTMTAQLIDDQQAAIASFNFEVTKATKRAADPSLAGTDLAAAKAAVQDAIVAKTEAETILQDMIKQAARTQNLLAKKQEALKQPSNVQADIDEQRQMVEEAKADLAAAVAAQDDVNAAVVQAQADLNYATASIPAKSANVSNAKILLSKATTYKVSADSSANLMASRAYNATIAAQQAEAAAKAAGYTWVW
ncbi:hypothetical protein CLOM_g14739 [Closterium sp. NIES-68]|nr:hypothetical protein CLOM_g14739 [Closterium sp. NIES-68]GJP57418.1 hypothetical protein CLOP_g20 [Closterium sp. NIES-67]